jgi:cytoskeleton protein RodZ
VADDGEAKLLLEFSNDCWVEIKDAQGNVLTSGLMRGNTTHTLSGPAPFRVTLGNAPAARIVLDDRLVDTTIYVPRRGTVSRFTLDRE